MIGLTNERACAAADVDPPVSFENNVPRHALQSFAASLAGEDSEDLRPPRHRDLPVELEGFLSQEPGFTFDPDQPPGGLPPAKLTPEFHAKMLKRIEEVNRGIEWDPISTCAPPGHPRWLTEPFLREFIVTPD